MPFAVAWITLLVVASAAGQQTSHDPQDTIGLPGAAHYGDNSHSRSPACGQKSDPGAVVITQPITPLFKIHEVVNLARADERIARTKTEMSVSETASAVEKNNCGLLVAQRQLVLAEPVSRNWKAGE
jgi:hypothetical protein